MSATDEQIVEMYRGGLSLEDVEIRCRASRRRITAALIEAGIYGQNGHAPWSEEDLRRLEAMVDLPTAEVAKQFPGRTLYSVRTALGFARERLGVRKRRPIRRRLG